MTEVSQHNLHVPAEPLIWGLWYLCALLSSQTVTKQLEDCAEQRVTICKTVSDSQTGPLIIDTNIILYGLQLPALETDLNHSYRCYIMDSKASTFQFHRLTVKHVSDSQTFPFITDTDVILRHGLHLPAPETDCKCTAERGTGP